MKETQPYAKHKAELVDKSYFTKNFILILSPSSDSAMLNPLVSRLATDTTL